MSNPDICYEGPCRECGEELRKKDEEIHRLREALGKERQSASRARQIAINAKKDKALFQELLDREMERSRNLPEMIDDLQDRIVDLRHEVGALRYKGMTTLEVLDELSGTIRPPH